MTFFDSVRRFLREFQEGVVEERVKLQVKALKESKLTDEFVTMTIVGDGELEKMTRMGWDLVIKITFSEQTLFNEYLVRKRRDELARSLGVDG